MSSRLTPGRATFLLLVALIYAFVLAPILVVLVAAVSRTPYLTFPPSGFTLRWFAQIATLGEFTDALCYSIEVATGATALSLLLGTWSGLMLARLRFRGHAALRSFFLAPVILPELALAIGLLQYFSRIGELHGAPAVILAHSIVCTPYVIRAVMAADAGLERAVEESAASLGAPPWRVLRDVMLPRLKPGLVSGGIMAFIISFDNVSISMFLTAPGAITLPALLYNQASESGLNTTLAAICALLVLFVLGVMLIVERLVGVEQFFDTVGGGTTRRRQA